jgi:hypothetical protein
MIRSSFNQYSIDLQWNIEKAMEEHLHILQVPGFNLANVLLSVYHLCKCDALFLPPHVCRIKIEIY